jgi:hypothetical protein
MKKLAYFVLVPAALAAVASAQTERSFPGISTTQMQQLRTAKRWTALPLPTWVPTGFKIEKIKMNLGAKVPIQFRVLEIVYSRRLPNGKLQRFGIEAGFEGIGDLPYEATSSVRSGVGQIDIAYEPPDLDGGGTKTRGYVVTHWFEVGKTPFHYDGMYGTESEKKRLAMISLADTQKILRSLQRF